MSAKVSPTHFTDLENSVQEALVETSMKQPAMWGRFYDTKSAGNLIPNQPSDFWLVHKGRCIFIEAKFSEVAESLVSVFSKAVSDNQIASARLAHRAGGFYWVVFYSSLAKQYEVWPGTHLTHCKASRRRLDLSARTLCPTARSAVDFIIAQSEKASGR